MTTQAAETAELNLLLEWPAGRPPSQWTGILAVSVALHLAVLVVVLRMPRLVLQTEPGRVIVVKKTPLYMPRDLLTQRAPNHQKVTKEVNLQDLLALQASQAERAAAQPSVRHFEMPKPVAPRVATKAPQILEQAPNIALNAAAPPLPGSQNGLLSKAPPPPTPANPFQNIGSDAKPDAKPTLAPPKASMPAVVKGLAQDSGGRHLIVTDENQSQPLPGAPGSNNQAGVKSEVELQSDPEGADFKPYLIRILSIVRANWRRVIPESARMGTLRGRTVVEFIINRDGSIPKIVMADPSGSDPLDRAALAGLSMSNPLPPLPADYKGFQARIAFTFTCNF